MGDEWLHPYGGVYRRRMTGGTYEVEKSMDDHLWRAFWNDGSYERTGLSAVGRRTAREARADAMDHYWHKDET